MPIIRRPNLKAEKHAMLDEFERDLDAFLAQFPPDPGGASEEDELFFEFDEEA